jgi:hypothetical protein
VAQRIVLHYLPGQSLLHRWDPRCKVFGLLLITGTLLHAGITWLMTDSLILIGSRCVTVSPKAIAPGFPDLESLSFTALSHPSFLDPGSRAPHPSMASCNPHRPASGWHHVLAPRAHSWLCDLVHIGDTSERTPGFHHLASETDPFSR